MQHDNQRIMGGRVFDAATGQQPRGIVPGQNKLRQPLDGDKTKQDDRANQAAVFSETQLALNPGPIAVMTERDGSPARSIRSSTNSTVGADILP